MPELLDSSLIQPATAALILALVFAGLVGLVLLGEQRNGPPVLGLAALCAAGAVVAAGWVLPAMVFHGSGPLTPFWHSLNLSQESAAPLPAWIMGFAGSSIPKTGAVAALGLIGLSFVALGQRASFAGLGLLALLIACILVSPLGTSGPIWEFEMNWGARPDRWAMALLLTFGFALCLPGPERGLVSALGLGAILSALVLTDISWALVAAALLALVPLVRLQSLLHVLLIAAAATLYLLGYDLLTGAVVPLLQSAHWPALTLPDPHVAAWLAGAILIYLALAGASAAPVSIRALIGLVLLAAIATQTGGAQYGLLAILPLFALERTGFLDITDTERMPHPLWAGLAGLALSAVLWGPLHDGAALASQHMLASRLPQQGNTAPFAIAATPDSPAGASWRAVTEGLQALDTLGAGLPSAGAVAVIGPDVPFAALLGKPAAASPDSAGFIMVPRPEPADWPETQATLDPAFQPVTELDSWTIWAR